MQETEIMLHGYTLQQHILVGTQPPQETHTHTHAQASGLHCTNAGDV